MGRNQYWAGRVYDLCVYYMTGTPEGSTESGFMEKPGIEPATPGLQGIALIHYTTGASAATSFGVNNQIFFFNCGHVRFLCVEFLIQENNVIYYRYTPKNHHKDALMEYTLITHLCCMEFSILMNWASPFHFYGLLGSIFHIFLQILIEHL